MADRALSRVAGDDPRGFLQGLVTQDVVTLGGDAPRWGGLLTPQGKALFDFLSWADGEAVLIDCEAEAADALVRRLSLYRLRRAVTIERVAGAVHWSPDASEGLPDPRLAALGRRWLADPGAPATGWRAHPRSLGVTQGVDQQGRDRTVVISGRRTPPGCITAARLRDGWSSSR